MSWGFLNLKQKGSDFCLVCRAHRVLFGRGLIHIEISLACWWLTVHGSVVPELKIFLLGAKFPPRRELWTPFAVCCCCFLFWLTHCTFVVSYKDTNASLSPIEAGSRCFLPIIPHPTSRPWRSWAGNRWSQQLQNWRRQRRQIENPNTWSPFSVW